MQHPFIRQYRLALITLIFGLCVVMVGAYVRLSDAGLGCPDWPGCYGQLIAPGHGEAVDDNFAHRPLNTAKAWKEMVHRYIAGTLGLLILSLAIWSWRNRNQPGQPTMLPAMLLLLVIFQAALGMWTVTLLVKPAVVTAHLLGGFATLVLLLLLALRLRYYNSQPSNQPSPIRWHTLMAIGLLVLQIILGGWTSTNYAALACSEFPTCYGGQWWPDMDFSEAFVIWRGTGVNYEFGVLDTDARTAIHVSHRIGALLVTLVIGWLSYRLMTSVGATSRLLGRLLVVVLLVQIGLGVANILGHLPLPIAVMHNGNAALLLLTLVGIYWYQSRYE